MPETSESGWPAQFTCVTPLTVDVNIQARRGGFEEGDGAVHLGHESHARGSTAPNFNSLGQSSHTKMSTSYASTWDLETPYK